MESTNSSVEERTDDDRCTTCGRAHERGKWLTALLGDECALCILDQNGDIIRNEPTMLADGGRK